MRRSWWVAGSVIVVLGLVLTIVLWPRGRDLPPTRARVYTDASACLLTDASGITGEQAAAVWAGMEAASVRTRTKVSYLGVAGDDSIGNAVPYVNTLVQRRCGLIIAVGPSEAGAIQQRASAFPAVRFAVVGSGSGQNLTAIAPGAPEILTGAADQLVASITDR
jgi:basic membrane lipoprotein Med (substrate-binding protein (PBP1-ABC) superfamily)